MRLLLLACMACNYYTPGSFADDSGAFRGAYGTVGCIDVAARLVYDTHGFGPVIAYAFGNRCAHDVLVDFTAVRVEAMRAGVHHALDAYDPDHEIRATHLDRWHAGQEMIAYPDTGAFDHICIDIGGLDADRPREERWLCIAG